MPIHVITFNVEHGNCHAILADDGRTVVIDLGVSDDFCPLTWLYQQGRTTIDLLVITHPHADHIRNIGKLRNFTVSKLHRPKNIPAALLADLDPALRRAWATLDASYTLPVPTGEQFWDAASPNHSCFELKFFGGISDTSNLNNYSIVTVLDYFGMKMVLPGDLEEPGWQALLRQRSFLFAAAGSPVLVAAHHGRAAGWCADLFSIINPQLVLISDGAEQDTSYASRYSAQATGAKVMAVSTGDIKEKCVVSTRDNGHIDIICSLQEQRNRFTGQVAYPWVYKATVERF